VPNPMSSAVFCAPAARKMDRAPQRRSTCSKASY